jgi:hypothetical protein
MMRTSFAPQARASRKSRSKRSSACSTVGKPASKFDRMSHSRVLGKFSTDCEASQKWQVNACAGIGFPQTSQSFDLFATAMKIQLNMKILQATFCYRPPLHF